MRLTLPLALSLLTQWATAAPPPPRPPRRRPILVDVHRPRDAIVLPGPLTAPVAITSEGEAVFLANENILGLAGRDGHTRWSLLVGPSRGAPALSRDGTCFVAGRDSTLYAVDRGGNLRWTRPLAGRPYQGVVIGSSFVAAAVEYGAIQFFGLLDGAPIATVRVAADPSAAPSLTSAGRLLLPSRQGVLINLDPGGVRWQIRLSNDDAGGLGPVAVGGDGASYVGTAEGWLYRVDADGRTSWRVRLDAPIARSPVLGADGTIYVAAGTSVAAVSPSGALRWRAEGPGPIRGGPLLADDGTVFIAAVNGQGPRGVVFAFDPLGNVTSRLPLAAMPMNGLTLSGQRLWVALQDWTLQRISVPQRELAQSPWAKARGDLTNSGASAVPR